jgi:hypothetical protein
MTDWEPQPRQRGGAVIGTAPEWQGETRRERGYRGKPDGKEAKPDTKCDEQIDRRQAAYISALARSCRR